MRQITFLSSTSTNYLFGRGRGKDKKKRKQRRENALVGAGAGLLGGGLGTVLGLKGSSLTPKQRLVTGAITLGGSTLAGAGLGSIVFDGKKPLIDTRKKTISPLEKLKTYQDKQNNKKYSSIAATVPLVTAGTIAGATRSKKFLGAIGNSHLASMSPIWGVYNGGMSALAVGAQADKQIAKEKARYQKEGARTRFGKIVNDTSIGVKSTAGILAANQAITQSVKSFAKRNGLPIKTKLLGAVGAGVGGAIYGAAKGAVIGGSVGAGVGTIRGFTQKNKK